MSIRVRYFAGLREALGTAGETLDLPAGVATVGGLRDWLARERQDLWERLLPNPEDRSFDAWLAWRVHP